MQISSISNNLSARSCFSGVEVKKAQTSFTGASQSAKNIAKELPKTSFFKKVGTFIANNFKKFFNWVAKGFRRLFPKKTNPQVAQQVARIKDIGKITIRALNEVPYAPIISNESYAKAAKTAQKTTGSLAKKSLIKPLNKDYAGKKTYIKTGALDRMKKPLTKPIKKV